MITAYFKFERLAEEVRATHKIRSAVRLDCTQFASFGVHFKGFDKLKNSKGHLVVYPSPCREVVKSNPKRRADICITNGSNISSIFQDFSNMDLKAFGWGDYGSDALLFLVNESFTMIEIFIVPNLRNIAESLFDKFLDGDFDLEIEKLRQNAKPFFNY